MNKFSVLLMIFFLLLIRDVAAPNGDGVEGIDPGGSTGPTPFGDSEGPGIPIDANTNFETVDLNGMTSEQIFTYFDRIPDWRFDELNQQRLAKALRKKYNIQDLDIDVGDENDNAEFTQDSFYFNELDYLNVKQTIINNGKNVRYKQGNLTAEHADSVIKDGSISTNVDDLNAGEVFFYLVPTDSLSTTYCDL